VVIKSLGWLRYKIGKKLAVETGQNLLSGRGIVIERVTAYDEQQAWLLFQKLDGRGISMIDATSFVIMKRLKIKEAFAFDTDFKTQGFTIYPG
jgi:predicted nucleic acid-binding protein